MKHPFLGAAGSFAHLLGGRRPAAKKAETEDRKDDEKDSEKSEGDEDDADMEDSDEEEPEAENDDKDGDGDTEKDTDKDGAKKAKGSAKVKTYAAGRADERKRCAAIFEANAAAKRPDLAAHLAFNTAMSAKDAVALLAVTAGGEDATSSKPAKPSGLSGRMATIQQPNVGAEGGQGAPDADSPSGTAARMTAIYDRLTGGGKK